MTVRVAAISVGRGVPRRKWGMAVHSAFPRAANLKPAGTGTLLTLLGPEEGDLPQGIRLDTPRGFTFEGLQVGASSVLEQGILTVADDLVVDLRGAKTCSCDLASLDADLADPRVEAAWEAAWEALRERRSQQVGSTSCGDAQMHEALRGSVCAVVEATRLCDIVGMAELEGLIGLGPGLTPAGDDFLVGYLAGLWCTTRGKPERTAFLASMAALVMRLSGKTNDISRTYLSYAARGQASARLVDLSRAICEGNQTATVWARAEAAMRMGHTSGTETVSGLLHGLAAWEGQHLLM